MSEFFQGGSERDLQYFDEDKESRDYLVAAGKRLSTVVGEGKLDQSSIESEYLRKNLEDDDLDSLKKRTAALDWFVDKGVVKRQQEGENVIYSMKPKAHKLLKTGRIATVHSLADHVRKITDSHQGDIDEIYEQHDNNRHVKKLSYDIDDDRASILPINELRIGHQDSRAGHALVRQEVDRLSKTPKHERPDVVLLSNLIQGDFSHSQSKKRAALAIGLDSNNAQFREAKKLLDEVKALDAPVIHNLGPDDQRIAMDYTKDVIREIEGSLKEGVKNNFIPYYEQNKLTQNKLFQEHYRFQMDYALPLCYRLGRRLRTANEVEELTNGLHSQSEYLLLYQNIKEGLPLPDELGIDEADVVKSGDKYPDGSVVVDDFDLTFNTAGGQQKVKYRHSTGLTPESLLGNHMDKPLRQLGNIGMMGGELAELNLRGRGQEMVYATSSRSGVLSLPGLADPIKSLDTRALHREVPGDASKRFDASRGRLIKPALDTVEMLDNGNIRHNINSGSLMEKSKTIPRMAIFEVCDMQIGSPTARQDYQVKYLSMILDKAKEMPVAIHFAGDIIHGNIYPNMAYEAQSQGLLRPESQMMVVSDMMHKIFGDAPKELRDAVIDVVVQQGNHDEIQRVKNFGGGNHSSNIDYLIRDAKDLFETPESAGKVRHGAVMLTDSGTPVPTWRAYSHYGAYTVLTAHYHLNRGAKGNSGGLPVYHALQRAQGLGNAETPTIILGAHWHNEQLAVINDVVSVVGGAMAERSEFEDGLGYDARPAGTVVEIGGGGPVSVEFVHEKALIDQKIKHGYFSEERLADNGFFDDKDYEPYKHAPYSFDYLPKSALHKAILAGNRQASERTVYETQSRNPNIYDYNGEPIYENELTQRLVKKAKELA